MNKLKKIIELKNEKIERMQTILDKATEETRAFSDNEQNEIKKLSEEVKKLEESIETMEEIRAMDFEKPKKAEEKGNAKTEETRSLEENEAATFEAFLRNKLETRAADDGNMTMGDNRAIIPSTIANKIIKTIEEICPIYNMTTKYHVKGDLVLPVDMDNKDNASKRFEAQYQDEFDKMQAQGSSFTSITLSGHLMGILSRVSLSLVNNGAFNLVDYVVDKLALGFARKLEKECLNGTEGKMTGVLSCTQNVTTAKADAINADELIELQDTIMDALQGNACWIMHRSTRTKLRKLKDADGRYLLNKDLSSGFGYSLLGKPVYVSDAMPKATSGETAIFYGDPSGLYVNIREDISINVARELYIEQHCIGVIGWAEIDSKIVEPQKLAKLTMSV